MTKFKTQFLKSPLNQKMNIWFSFLICYFYDNIDHICESLFSKKIKILTLKNHVIGGSRIFTLWHKKRDTVVCIYLKSHINHHKTCLIFVHVRNIFPRSICEHHLWRCFNKMPSNNIIQNFFECFLFFGKVTCHTLLRKWKRHVGMTWLHLHKRWRTWKFRPLMSFLYNPFLHSKW